MKLFYSQIILYSQSFLSTGRLFLSPSLSLGPFLCHLQPQAADAVNSLRLIPLIFRNRQQFKIICLMSSILSRFPILSPLSLEILEEGEYSQPVMEAIAKIEENGEEIVEMILVEQLIMLYLQQKNESQPLAYIRLDSSLKFQRNFRIETLSRTLTGIRLTNDRNESICFYIQSPATTASLIHYLSQTINQTNFHNLYKPLRIFGRGSFATVYEVVRVDDGQRFACKIFPKESLKGNLQKRRSFISELDILRFIQHPNLLRLESVFESDSTFYVILEGLAAGNLFEYLIRSKTGLATPEIQGIMRSLLHGLDELAKDGIVHRDIKPENLMLREKNILDPVIADFGLAVFEDDEDYNYYQCGTPGYISPQVLALEKGRKITSKSDIFSAGVVLHVLLTGRYLFEGSNPKEVFENNKKMEFNLDRIEYHADYAPLFELMRKMLEVDPLKRYSAEQCLKHESLALGSPEKHETEGDSSETSDSSLFLSNYL